MERREIVFEYLDRHGIRYDWYEHPEAPTVEIARRYWEERHDGSTSIDRRRFVSGTGCFAVSGWCAP